MQLHGHKNYQFANLSSNQPAKKSSTKLHQNYNLILAHKGYQNYYCTIKNFNYHISRKIQHKMVHILDVASVLSCFGI